MAELYTYNSTHLSTIRDGTVELTQSAEAGAIGTGRFAIDDTAGTLSIVGQKDFLYTQSSASSNTRVFRGFIGDRQYGRDAGTERAPHVSKGRGIAVELQDLNSMLGFRLINAQNPDLTVVEGGRRPAETVNARMAWIMGSPFTIGLFTDNGRVASSTVQMDAADYRNQFPGDVISDCATAANFNYHVQDYGSGPELIFRDDNTSTADSSSLRISNVAADVDSWHDTVGATSTFAPSRDATLVRRPGNVVSKVAVAHAKGTVIRERTATSSSFNGERSQVSSNSRIQTAATAAIEGDRLLWVHHTEEDTIDCTIQVPASAVNLIPAGWRIQAKFEHFTTEGYGSFTWMRVIERTVRPLNAEAASYEIDLRLVPQEEAEPAPACSEDATPAGTYYPLGAPVPGTGGLPNVSDGVVYYFRSGFALPTTPTPGWQGGWHFPNWGAGGTGTIDFAGSCVGNKLILMTVGNGSWTIQTEAGGTARGLVVNKGDYGTFGSNPVATLTPGQSVEVEIDDATEGDCVRFVQITDATGVCGSYWGWSEAVWVPA